MSKTPTYQEQIGSVINELRKQKDLTQSDLAAMIGTSQSAIHRIEAGDQNISLDMVKKISTALGQQILSINDSVSQSYRINGGKQLSGEITINSSKNAAVGLLCAALLNTGKTVFRHVARIEEVYRIIEVLESIVTSHVLKRFIALLKFLNQLVLKSAGSTANATLKSYHLVN